MPCSILFQGMESPGNLDRIKFTMRQVMARLNPARDARRCWAVEKAVERMAVTTLVRLGAGRCWLISPGALDVQ